MKILLTGEPHCGKTTLITKLIDRINPKQGFVTQEIPDPANPGQRLGFELVDHTGRKNLLAHVESDSQVRVSKYGVDVNSLEQFLGPLFEIDPTRTLYIDEIGQMELYSAKFKELVECYLKAPNNFIGTITSVFEDDFVLKLRHDPRVKIVEVTNDNRDSLLGKLTEGMI